MACKAELDERRARQLNVEISHQQHVISLLDTKERLEDVLDNAQTRGQEQAKAYGERDASTSEELAMVLDDVMDVEVHRMLLVSIYRC